ncbi:MAG: phosphosulfolactate synthase [Streptosporangiaceae bacterium]
MSEHATLSEYLNLSLPGRTEDKPRDTGLTMVMDQGWPTDFVAGMLEQFGRYLDIVKLWDPQLLSPVAAVRRKIDVYRSHDVRVQPGGLFMEIAKKQGKDRDLVKLFVDLGFDMVEISSTTSTRTEMSADLDMVAYAKANGLTVVGEVGRKFADGDETRLTEDTIDIETTVREFRELLDAGAWKVYWEGHLLRQVLGDDPEMIKQHAATGTAQVREVAGIIGESNIMFEASGLRPRANRQWLQFWLVRLFGPDVNVANARVEELANLEAIRRGNHPIHGFGSAGNYPWVRAMGDGGSGTWWRG